MHSVILRESLVEILFHMCITSSFPGVGEDRIRVLGSSGGNRK